VKGKVTTSTPIHADRHTLAKVTFSTAATNVDVVNGATRNLQPGNYGEVRVGAGGTLSLSAGTYDVRSLTVLPEATLNLDETAGAVVVYIESGFAYAGKETQLGGDGQVLIAVFGCAPAILTAPFRGTVSAQNAWLSLIAPTKSATETFAGRFFANSIEVGAYTTVIGLGLTLPNGPPQAAGGPPPQPPAPLPAPPSQGGCYVNTPNGWQPVECATDAFIDSHFPHPDAQLVLSSSATQRSSATPLLVFGQVEATIPQVASEQNAPGWIPPVASEQNAPGCTSSGSPLPNQWSVQNNTDQWTIPSGFPHAGDIAEVQFTIQSHDSTSAICIWQIDVTKQDYSNKTCYSPSIPLQSGGLQAFDFGNIAATAANGTLSMVAELSWVPPGQPNQYAVVQPNGQPVADTYNLAQNWYQIGGGLIGLGACSQAQFINATNAEVVTQVMASTCLGDTSAKSPTSTCPSSTLQPNASASEGSIGTLETNNLTAIGTPSVSYLNSDLAVSSLWSSTCTVSPFPVASYVFAPASEISVSPAAQTPVSITVTAYDAGDNPIACAPVWLTFQPAQNGGSMKTPAMQPYLLIADSNGQVSFTYTTPAVFPPAGGTDTILAANSANGGSTTASWSYTICPTRATAELIPAVGGEASVTAAVQPSAPLTVTVLPESCMSAQ
jgi:hypothetical protein